MKEWRRGKKTKERVFRIRYRSDLGPKSKLVICNDSKKAKRLFEGGRVLRINKISQEELFHVGEYNQLPETLMKEFGRGPRPKLLPPVEEPVEVGVSA